MAIERTDLGSQRTIHWSVILAGAFTALGCWMFLYALGAAIGGAATKTRPDSWTAIYTLVSPVIAFFLGGLVVARSRGIEDRADGALHGIVVWGFAMVLGSLLLSLMGAEVLVHTRGAVNLPAGYFWAVAGSILGSLITSVLGSMALPRRVSTVHREELTTGVRREVYP